MIKQRKLYTVQFKIRAVELSHELESIKLAAVELGIGPENIRRWRTEFRSGRLSGKARKKQPHLKLLIKELSKVKLERDILRKCGKYLNADRKAKFDFIKEHTNFPAKDMCRVLGVSKSSYYKWLTRTPSKRDQRNQALTEQIQKIHLHNRKRYGSPRIAKELEASGYCVSEKLIRKLMKQASLQSVFRRKFKTTTNSAHNYLTVENKLNRKFFASRENEIWVSDITYIKAATRWLYLTVIIDLYDRSVVGWSLSSSLATKYTSIMALKMAISKRPIKDDSSLIFHSDRGLQYACKEFVYELSKYSSVGRSMSRKGNCWDNAVCESFFKILKTELILENHYKTKEEAELSISEYIETFYNFKRRHSHLYNLTISEYRKIVSNF